MRRLIATLSAVLAVSACSVGAQDMPLPGSRISGDTLSLTAVFDDALNLAEGAPVKLNGVTVGRVDSVTAEDFKAKVTMTVKESAGVRADAAARLRGTTPLGELYVDLDNGKAPATAADGAQVSDTATAPTIEDAMASASMFINGGGLAELGSIVREANLAIGGREETAQDLLIRLERTTRELNRSGDDIDAALSSLAGLSTILHARQNHINQALAEIGPAAREVRSHVDDLIALLKQVRALGTTSTAIVNTVHDDLIQGLRQMGPIFDEMNSLESELTPVIETLVTFSELLDKGVPTAYLNTYLHFHLDGFDLGLPGSPPQEASESDGGSTPEPGSLFDDLQPDSPLLTDPDETLRDTVKDLLGGLGGGL